MTIRFKDIPDELMNRASVLQNDLADAVIGCGLGEAIGKRR